jgi:predicted transcriptional regulator
MSSDEGCFSIGRSGRQSSILDCYDLPASIHVSSLPNNIPPLRLANDDSSPTDHEIAAKVFHRINRVLPETQEVVHVRSGEGVLSALETMERHGLSQLPVLSQNGRVLGLFSHERLSKTLRELSVGNQAILLSSLKVQDCLKQIAFRRVSDEFTEIINLLDQDGAVLVGSPETLQGILTPIDVVRYFEKISRPFILILEAEIAIRQLIRNRLSEAEIEQIAQRCFKDRASVPQTLEEMTFDNYRLIITHTELAWPKFEATLGNRGVFNARMKFLADVRNIVFHFKQAELSIAQHQDLSNYRNWLLGLITIAQETVDAAQ